MNKYKFKYEVFEIIDELMSIENYKMFFSNDVLNSEGRKRIEKIAKILAGRCVETKNALYKLRRNPTWNNTLKYIEKVLECIERKYGGYG